MIPALLMLKPIGAFMKSVPREIYYAIAVAIALLILRSHYIGVGVERCEATQKKAFDKAVAESIKQEKRAPVIAQEARDAIQPIVNERIRIIREKMPATCNDAYPDGVQAVIREARTSSHTVR